MATFVAHYTSPAASTARASGLFEFESDARLGSKANQADARMAMLELFGKDAVSWTISSIEHKKAKTAEVNGQLTIDFREPAKTSTRKKRIERGVVK